MATVLPSPATLDEGTAQAVHVLALAVQRERVPGVIEFGVACDALARAASSRERADLDYATVAFDSLDPHYRTRIVNRAYELARSERGHLRMPQLPQPEHLMEARAPLRDAMDQGAARARNRLMADLDRKPRRRATEIREPELAPTLEEILPIQARFDGPPPKWWE